MKLIRKESELGVADRREYEEKFNRNYTAPSCHQLWQRPRINFADGRVLGCSINHWDDFGNVFTNGGLEVCLKGEKMQRTKDMLMGVTEEDTDSPCVKCQVYASMVKNNAWIRPQELVGPSGGNERNASSLLSRSIRLRRQALSKGIFIYSTPCGPLVGEPTMTPWAGMRRFPDKKFDRLLGKKSKLPKESSERPRSAFHVM